MFLTDCMTGWIMLTVLSPCVHVWSAVMVSQPYRVTGINGTAKIKCFIYPQPTYQSTSPPNNHSPYPYPDPEELRVSLLKGLHGRQHLCSSILSVTEQKEINVAGEQEAQCYAQVRDSALEVTVTGLRPEDTDIYRCDIEVFYPPPYLRLTGNGTLVHVPDSSGCTVQDAQTQISFLGYHDGHDEDDKRTASVSVPVVVLVILVTFVIMIIIFLQTLNCQRRRRVTEFLL
ncbi:T-cell-specific surface glycoprotein CD28 homolog [Aulostomus maculatus]